MNRDVCEHFNPVALPCDKCEAKPAQEPVAWRWGYRSITTGEMDWRGYVEIPAHPNLRSPEIIMQPLYAAPPQRPAEPVQEPVAWLVTDCIGERYLCFSPPLDNDQVLPLYAAPPQRKPLTEEEIYSLFRTVASPVMFARAIERAHGIV